MEDQGCDQLRTDIQVGQHEIKIDDDIIEQVERCQVKESGGLEVWRMEDHEWYSLSDAKSVKKHKIKINGDIKPVKKHGTKETFVSLNLVEGCGSGRVESAGMQVGQGYGRGRGRGHQPNVVVKDGMQVVEKGFGRAYVIRKRQLEQIQFGGVTGSMSGNHDPSVGGCVKNCAIRE